MFSVGVFTTVSNLVFYAKFHHRDLSKHGKTHNIFAFAPTSKCYFGDLKVSQSFFLDDKDLDL